MDSQSKSPHGGGRNGSRRSNSLRYSPLRTGFDRPFAAGHTAAETAGDALSAASLLDELVPPLVALLLAVQTLTAVVLVGRRSNGPFMASGVAGWILAWTAVIALAAAASRALWFSTGRRRLATGDVVVILVPLTAVFMTACVLSSSPGPAAAIVLVWLIALGEEIAAFTLVARFRPAIQFDSARGEIAQFLRRLAGLQFDAPQVRPHPRRSVARPPVRRSPAADLPSTTTPALVDERTVRNRHSIARLQTVDGRDALHGAWSTYLAPGQTTAQIHIAFCPPFAAVPRLEYRQVAGPPARIKIGQALPHGARLEVKLTAADGEESRVEINVVATCDTSVAERVRESPAQESPGEPGG